MTETPLDQPRPADVPDPGHDSMTMEGRPPAVRLVHEGRAGLLFLAIGTVVVLLVSGSSLTCERQTDGRPACVLERRVLFDRVTFWRTEIGHLQRAYSDELIPEQGKSIPNYQAMLATDLGYWRMNVLGDRESVAAVVATIDGYLRDSQTRELRAEFVPGGFGVLRWVGRALLAIGIIYLLPVPIYLVQMALGIGAAPEAVEGREW